MKSVALEVPLWNHLYFQILNETATGVSVFCRYACTHLFAQNMQRVSKITNLHSFLFIKTYANFCLFHSCSNLNFDIESSTLTPGVFGQLNDSSLNLT